MKTVEIQHSAPSTTTGSCPKGEFPVVSFDWFLQIGLATLFFASATSKLIGNPVVIAQFTRLGFEEPFVLILGIIEVLTGVLLLIPKVAHCGGILAVVTLTGVIFSHTFKLGISFNEKGEFYLLTMGTLGLIGAVMIIFRRRGELAEIFQNSLNQFKRINAS
jgi:putative oxidoreductase